MEKIITIGREFGSGGHEIGRRLAEALRIPVYDKELINMVAETAGLTPAFVARNEEGVHRVNSRSGRMNFASIGYSPSFSDSIFLHQCEAIRGLADAGPCVIVGRCADFVLKEYDTLNVFISSGMELKIARKRLVATEMAGCSDEQMARYIKNVNKARKQYYEQYTGQKWGDIHTYDLCLHSDAVGIEGTVRVIMAYLESMK